jgi:hypothetical protein
MEQETYLLKLVVKVRLEMEGYAVSGISNWRKLMAMGYPGPTPSAYEAQLDVFGQKNAAIIIAGVLHQFCRRQLAGTDRKGAGRGGFFGSRPMAALKANGVPQLVMGR